MHRQRLISASHHRGALQLALVDSCHFVYDETDVRTVRCFYRCGDLHRIDAYSKGGTSIYANAD